MSIMTDRLEQLLSATSQMTANQPLPRPSYKLTVASTMLGRHFDVMEVEANDQLPNGWWRVDPVQWKPCPIGIFQRA